ncbi:hypothetical protein [Bacteroides acidifaciens]|uniref:Uncharacterized protein n=1 Tax=Bacteroides acidifaciens TaxID=85831 RepID=A0A8H0HRG9_9BACE|nr:hypothetical protein [Bacteroides acidifaciens]MBF0730848.1 hypothetical protein [Bacteroides acidifaciens]TFU47230.1 hypothetical protein E4T97_15370 [Bacteroides acidifaciens]
MEGLSQDLGMSYGELNVWLFVIIQPATILLFMTTTVVLSIMLYRKNCQNKTTKFTAATVSLLSVICYVVALVLAGLYVWAIMAIMARAEQLM